MINICTYIRHIGGGLISLVYPTCCAVCGAPGTHSRDLCPGCRHDLPWNGHACRRCALPMPRSSPPGLPCASCQQLPPSYDSAWSPLQYSGSLRWLHRRFKFGRRLAHAGLLDSLLADALEQAIAQGHVARPQVLLVMPLHARRLVTRGFNQSLELIRPAAKRLRIELDYQSLRRTRPTLPQADLPASLRRRNVRGAFACDRDLGGMRVALFDDVITTGHTAAEAVRALRRAGATEIYVWSLARTPELNQ